MMAVQSGVPGVALGGLLEGFADVDAPCAVSGLQTDSRKVAPGDLFLAVRGLQVHGLQYAAQAVNRGAAAIVWEPAADPVIEAGVDALGVPAVRVEGLSQRLGVIAGRFYAEPSEAMHVIGVTGTDGKTSVTHFIAQALSGADRACGLLGTLGYGVYGALAQPTHTTPDALRLQAELARLRDAGVNHVAMEVSSHALHQHRVEGVTFNTAVLTQLSRDHLDYHGSIEAYAQAKRRLFQVPDLETAVLNVDDAFGRTLAEALRGHTRVISYGRAGGDMALRGDDWIELVEAVAKPRGLALELDTSRGGVQFETQLLGAFNADNLMAALGALLASGMTLEDAVAALASVTTVPGRMELFTQAGRPGVVVDYAHTPRALEAALQALRAHCTGELVCVFGAGGDRDTGKRAPMGAAAERYADRVVVTSDNPRSEDPQAIVEQVIAGFRQPARAQSVIDRGEAIDQAIAAAAADDLILVAGKGHETTQQIGEARIGFSDRERVRQALRGRAG